MKRKMSVVFSLSALCSIFLTGCSSSESIEGSELSQYDVSQPIDEVVQENFAFRLVSEKEIYQKGERCEFVW